jgi:hypothetical protein
VRPPTPRPALFGFGVTCLLDQSAQSVTVLTRSEFFMDLLRRAQQLPVIHDPSVP